MNPWSTRLLGRRLEVSNPTIARAWRAHGIKPWKAESFPFFTDPELVGKFTYIDGLHLAPLENAIVLCMDEKAQIQALDYAGPILPMQEGRIRNVRCAATPRQRYSLHRRYRQWRSCIEIDLNTHRLGGPRFTTES